MEKITSELAIFCSLDSSSYLRIQPQPHANDYYTIAIASPLIRLDNQVICKSRRVSIVETLQMDPTGSLHILARWKNHIDTPAHQNSVTKRCPKCSLNTIHYLIWPLCRVWYECKPPTHYVEHI